MLKPDMNVTRKIIRNPQSASAIDQHSYWEITISGEIGRSAPLDALECFESFSKTVKDVETEMADSADKERQYRQERCPDQ